MSELVTVVLVGIGGYGGTYCNLLLNQGGDPVARIVGVVDPFAEKANFYTQLKEKNIPFYNTLTEFYQQHKAELAVISTPARPPPRPPGNVLGSNVEPPAMLTTTAAARTIQINEYRIVVTSLLPDREHQGVLGRVLDRVDHERRRKQGPRTVITAQLYRSDPPPDNPARCVVKPDRGGFARHTIDDRDA